MLHMMTALKGFHIQTIDGTAGHVDDFLVDQDLHLRQLVVDTSNWPGGKAVLLPVAVVTKIDAPNKQIHVTMSCAEVAECPPLETAEIELIETLPFTMI